MKVLNSKVSSSSNPDLFEFTNGIDLDSHLWTQELKVQRAWLQELEKSLIISPKEKSSLEEAYKKIELLFKNNTFPWSKEDEDIHMNMERVLVEECGELGKKIHLGRSRNDLIATTLRLFVNDRLSNLIQDVKTLGTVIKNQSINWVDVLIPGMTHLQFGQPIRLGHLFSAHSFSLKRDLKRFKNCQIESLSYCPLGAAAFAGTHLNIDLKNISTTLGFQSPLIHSYDAVGDRDFILETLNSFAVLAVHLCRLSEDVLFLSSSPIKVLMRIKS